MTRPWTTVVETKPFIKFRKDVMSEREGQALIDHLARNPEAGDLIQGTGGCRKVRFAAKGKGKSGGVRVVTYFADPSLPLYLLDGIYKGDREDFSPGEKKIMRELTARLKKVRRNKT